MTERTRVLPTLVLVGVTLFLVGLAKHRTYISGDGWWYAAVGRDYLENGFSLLDSFTYTAPARPYVNKFFAATVVWALILKLGGFALYLCSAASGVMVLLWMCLQGRARWPVRLAALPFVLVLLGVDGQFFEARAQNPAHLLFLGTLALLFARGPLTPKRALAFGLLAVVWTNWHPSFLLTLGLPLLVALLWRVLEREEHRPPLLAPLGFAGLGLVAAFVTPFGARLLPMTLNLVIDPTTSSIEHMRSPAPTIAWMLFAGVTLLAVAARASSPREEGRSSEVALVLAFLAMTWLSQRYAALSMIVTLRVVLSALDDHWPESASLNPREGRAVLAFALGAALIGGVLLARERDSYLWGPTTAVDWMAQNHPPGRVFNEYAAGGYLMWRWGPERRVFIDGRNDLFTNGVFDDYGEMMRMSSEGRALFDVYGVNTVIAKPMDELHPAFDYVKGWRLAFEGEDGVVYVREKPVDTRVIRPSDRSR